MPAATPNRAGPRRSARWGRAVARLAASLVLALVGVLAVSATAHPATAVAAPPAVPAPVPTGLPTTTPGTPCSGPQCLPAPTTTTPETPSAPPPVTGDGDTTTSCGLLDPTTWGVCVNNVLTGFFRMVVADALNPLLDLLGHTLLATPTPDQIPQLAGLWMSSWQLVLACYGLIVLLGGVLVMAYETLQTRYTIREIAPRLAVGMIAAAVSMTVATAGIMVANALSAAVMGDGVDTATAAEALKALYLSGPATQGVFEDVLDLILAGGLVAVLLTYIVRVVLTILLIAGAPLMLMAHGLPHTEGIAHTWWKTFGGCLAIQVAQSLTLIVAIRILLTPGFTPLGPTKTGLVNLLIGLALVYVLVKIPFWILGAARGGGGRRSLVGSLVRGFVAYKTFGLPRGRGGGYPRVRSRASQSGSTQSGLASPYAKARTTATGQYMLPLTGLKRGTLPKPSHPRRPSVSPGRPRRVPRGVQLALPLGQDWPENRPVLGRDGQYRLPLDVRRRPTPTTSQSTPHPVGGSHPAGRQHGGQQLRLPFDTEPFRGNRPLRSGQYPLPFDGVKRVPPAAPAPASPAVPPRPAPRAGRQLRLPLDLPHSTRPTPPRTSGGRP